MKKITQWLLFLALMMVPMMVMSQVMVSQYALESGTDSTKWVSLPADTAITKTLIVNGGDSRASDLCGIGFDFYFGGASYTQFSVNTDGNMRLGGEVTSTSGYVKPFGRSVSSNLPKINGMGCDGMMKIGGYVKKAVMGTAPNRVLVVEFRTAKYEYNDVDSSDVMWQVQLFEGTNEIQLVYSSEAPSVAPNEFQIGMASSELEVLTLNTSIGGVVLGATDEVQTEWPVANSYYRFYAPNCIRPMGLEVLNISNDSVEFCWNRGVQTTWQYACVGVGVLPDWNAVMSVNDTVGVVGNLQPNTDYIIYVRNDCGGEYSDAIMMPIHTGCITMDGPIEEGFEECVNGEMPNCWTSIDGTSGVYTNGYSDESRTGSNSLKMGLNDVVVAPRLKMTANEMMMVAYVQAGSYDAGLLDIGYVTSVADEFHVVRTVTADYDAYQECIIDYSLLGIMDTIQPAFRWHDVEDLWYNFYIDDVEIMKIPSCRKPTYAYARNITQDGATIVWEPNEEVMSFDVAYGLSDSIELATRMNVVVGEDSVRLENLLSDTTYYAWVRNMCDNDSSRWVALAPFKTKASCAEVIDLGVSSVGYTDASVYWTVDNSYGGDVSSVELSYKKGKDTVWSAPIVVNESYYILQGLESGNPYDVRLRARCGQDSSAYVETHFVLLSCGMTLEGDGLDVTDYLPIVGYYKYAYSQMLYPSTYLSGLDTIRGVAFHIEDAYGIQDRVMDVYIGATNRANLTVASPYPMDSLEKVATDVVANTAPGWVTLMFDSVFVYDGTSNLLITLEDHTGSYSSSVYSYKNSEVGSSLYRRSDSKFFEPGDLVVNDMSAMRGTPDIKFVGSCEVMSCDAPRIAFGDITSNMVELHWLGNGNVAEWVVEYRLEGAEDWVSNVVNVPTYTMNDLLSGRKYEVRVGSVCGGDTLYDETLVMTDCEMALIPFEENFDDSELLCWKVSDDLSWDSDGGKIDYDYEEGEYMITPAMDVSLNSLQLMFKIGASSIYNGGALVVSCGEDPLNLNTFVAIDTISVAQRTPMTQQLVSLSNYMGEGRYIMFSSFTGHVYFDELRVDIIPECSMPMNLAVSDITSGGATVRWTDNSLSVEKWLVSYTKVGETIATVYEVAYDAGASHTVSGLDGNSEYRVTVSTICTSGDTNETIHPITFRTECGAVELPYNEDFEGIDAGEYHLCWYRDEPVTTMNEDYGWDGIEAPAVFMGEYGSNTVVLSMNKAIASPKIPLPANQISLNFDMKVQDTARSGKLVVGFSNSSSDYGTMIVVDTLDIDTNSWNNYTINFNRLNVTDTGYVVFKNIENVEITGLWDINYYIWLDNIDFSEYSSCVRPYDVQITDVTSSTAMVNFRDSVGTNSYTVAWNTVNDIATATTINVTTTTAQLNNLQSGTTYYVWVRSNCSENTYSSWVNASKMKTQCEAQDVPYLEDFNNYTYGIAQAERMPEGYPNHTMPDCWNVMGMNRNGDTPIIMISDYPGIAVSGNVLYIETDENEAMYAILPKFATTTDSLMLSCTYVSDMENNMAEDLVLGVMTDPYDVSTFVAVKGLPNVGDFVTIEHPFVLDEAVAPNTNYYIAFRIGGAGASVCYGIDNVKVEYAPSCIRPEGLNVTRMDNMSVSATWRGTASSYEVQYRVRDTASWSSTVVMTNAVALSNLMSGVEYEMRVRGICSTTENSEWSEIIVFKTMCAPVAIPWSENFDSYVLDIAAEGGRPDMYPEHEMPDCWIFSPMTFDEYGGPAAWLTIQSNVNDGNALCMYSDEHGHMYAVMPAMGANLDTLMISFDYSMSSYAAQLKLGVLTNPCDFGTFVGLETYPVTTSATMVEHYFVFDNLNPNETYYIAFDCGLSDGYSTLIDNIVVNYISSCIRPEGLRAYASDNSAIVKWSTPSMTSEVKYHEVGFDTWTTTTVNEDTINLVGLNVMTMYEVAVRSICGNGDTSTWSDPLLFSTICTAHDLPLVEDFNTITGSSLSSLNCWSFYKGLVTDVLLGTEVLDDEVSSNWRHKEDVTGSLAFINICGTECNDWMVTPTLSITSGAMLSFDVAFMDYWNPIEASNYADDRFYVMVTADNGMTWDKLVTWGPDADDTYPMSALNFIADSISVDLAQYAGQKIRIAFYGESTESGGDNNLHIDNIFVDGIPCGAPVNLEATPEAVSAVITWEGDGQNYEIAIREDEVAVWQDSVAVIGLTHTFAGLMPEITYAYRVRQVCGEGLYSDWVEGTFATLPLPCGKPEVTISEITGDGATFNWAQGENHTAWEVEVFNAMYDTVVDVAEPRFVITELEHDFDYNVAVRAKCAENVYSDWSDTLQFRTLDCLPVTDVAVSEITENSVKVAWNAGGNETSWEINYGESGFGQGEGLFVESDANTYTLTNLEPAMDYDLYVRAICSEDFYSVWSDVVSFTTLEGTPEGIDGVDGNYQFTIHPNPTTNATTITLNGVEGKVVISVVDMNGRMIQTETLECGTDCEKRLDVANLAQGTYFVRILGNSINSVRKLIIR